MLFIKYILIYNAFIIVATASLSLLFRRRIFALSMILLLWIAVGVTDMVLLSFRTTPFTAVDLMLIADAFKIAHRYFSWWGVVLLIIAVIAAIIGSIWIFKKCRKEDGKMEITFTYEADDDTVKSGTYSFEEGEDYIKIGGAQYKKVEK